MNQPKNWIKRLARKLQLFTKKNCIISIIALVFWGLAPRSMHCYISASPLVKLFLNLILYIITYCIAFILYMPIINIFGRVNAVLCIYGKSICLIRPLEKPHTIKSADSIADYTSSIKKKYRTALAHIFTPFIHGKKPDKKYTRKLRSILKQYAKKGTLTLKTDTNGTIFKYILDYFNIEKALSSLTESQKEAILKEILPEADFKSTNFHDKVLETWSECNKRIEDLLKLPNEIDSINTLPVSKEKVYTDLRDYNLGGTKITIRAYRKTTEEEQINESLIYIDTIRSDSSLIDQILEKGKRHKFKIQITITKSN